MPAVAVPAKAASKITGRRCVQLALDNGMLESRPRAGPRLTCQGRANEDLV